MKRVWGVVGKEKKKNNRDEECSRERDEETLTAVSRSDIVPDESISSNSITATATANGDVQPPVAKKAKLT